MPADLIRADYPELERVAQSFDVEAERIRHVHEVVELQLARLKKGGWEGDNAAEFYRAVDVEVSAISKLQQALAESGKTTREIIRLLKEAEEEAAAYLRGEVGVAEQSASSGQEQPATSPVRYRFISYNGQKGDDPPTPEPVPVQTPPPDYATPTPTPPQNEPPTSENPPANAEDSGPPNLIDDAIGIAAVMAIADGPAPVGEGAGLIVVAGAAVLTGILAVGWLLSQSNSQPMDSNEAGEGAAQDGQAGAAQPQVGQPVPGLENADYIPSRTTSPEDRDYEARVTGKPDPDIAIGIDVGTTRPAELDWIDETEDGEIILVDAKNASPGGMYDLTDETGGWPAESGVGEERILEEAERQVEAMNASGASSVEWRVPDQEIADALQGLFDRRQLPINVQYYP